MAVRAEPVPGMDRVEGLFGPESITWRVNREAVLLAGGGRALILQVAHPLVAAGVEQHSDYDVDPWGRLYRTLDITTKIVFGDAETSEHAALRLRGAHASVNGSAGDGTPYDARDPDLLLWVWATLVESSVLVYQRYVERLTPEEIERYYVEQTRFAVACGVPEGHWPEDWRAFVRYFDRTVAEELTGGEDCRAIVRAVLRPDVPAPARPAFELLNLVTVGLLPETVRERLGLPWTPRRERIFRTGERTLRAVLPSLPALLRDFPAATSARRRVRVLR
jgi:uncharacterized protein (DUF2236 family)